MGEEIEQSLHQFLSRDIAQVIILIEVEHCGIAGLLVELHRLPCFGHDLHALAIERKLPIALGVAIEKQALAIT